ncbi:MAG TPA: hypothetical protein VM431_09450 [Phycisphaerae bacterium]|nr:hypothetical protein [Phycisphaerae bacterium]
MDVPRKLVLLVLALSAGLAAGCWGYQQTRRDVYMNLMTPVERAKYSYMEATRKPVSLRLAYLQGIGVYQTWAEQPNNVQEAILRCQVLEGMIPLQVEMAWGSPEERRDITHPAERAEGHTKVVWEYGIRTQKVGGTSYERSVCFYDDLVLWVRQYR